MSEIEQIRERDRVWGDQTRRCGVGARGVKQRDLVPIPAPRAAHDRAILLARIDELEARRLQHTKVCYEHLVELKTAKACIRRFQTIIKAAETLIHASPEQEEECVGVETLQKHIVNWRDEASRTSNVEYANALVNCAATIELSCEWAEMYRPVTEIEDDRDALKRGDLKGE